MAATKTVTQLLDDVIESFFGKYPFLAMFIIQYEENIVLNQQYLATIDLIPEVTAYAAGAGGFFPDASTQNAENLQEDVAVKADGFPLVHLKWGYYQSIQDKQKKYDQLVSKSADRLAKHLVDTILGKSTADNFTESSTIVAADADHDLLDQITTDMNGKAAGDDRYLLVNSAVAGGLAGDDRIGSSDFHGQMNGGRAYRRWSNVAGFREIVEYPSLPANGENLVGMAFDERAFAFVEGVPSTLTDVRELVKAPAIQSFEPWEHESGFSMVSAAAEKRGEPDVDWAIGAVIGCHAGTGSDLTPGNASVAGKLTDYAGHRLVTV